MPTIHPTALVDPSARLGEGVDIGPYAIVEAGAVIGDRTRVMASAFIAGCATIGADCEIHLGAAVGGAPQMRIMDGPGGRVRIGNGTILREYVTVHRAVKAEAWTVVGDRGYLLATSHVGHDCVVGHDVTIANGALLAGYVSVGDRAFISGNTAVHQFVRIGRVAMVGGLARVPKDVPPFTTVACDGSVYGLNVVGMRRAGLSAAERLDIKRAYQAIYRSGLNVSQAIHALRAQPASAAAREIIAFFETSERGVCAWRRSRQRMRQADDVTAGPSDVPAETTSA